MMAEFQPAFDFLLPHEGGYNDDPSDRGGKTKFGISKATYPDLDIVSLTVDDAAAIYKRDWWDTQLYRDLKSQDVANKVFDLAVNMGFYEAHRILQLACCECGSMTICDGRLGPVTIQMANMVDPVQLLQAIKDLAARYYRRLTMLKPSNAKFLAGWITRANA